MTTPWVWLKDNKDSLSVIFSVSALMISSGSLFLTLAKERRDRLRQASEKLPIIAIKTDRAVTRTLYMPHETIRPEGWQFYAHLDIENRFGAPCSIDRISGESRVGIVRLCQPISSDLKEERGYDALIGNRSSTSYRPLAPGSHSHLAFHIHVECTSSKSEIESGIPIILKILFEIQADITTMTTIERQFVLRPGYVVVEGR